MKVSANLKLVAPTMDYAEQIMEYKTEFLNEGRTVIDGSCGLVNFDTPEAYLENVKSCSHKTTVPEGLVPASTYLAINENNKVVGIINIRHELSEILLKMGGHIGYGIRESERRKGYATEMLKQALEKCKELNLEKVLVTCNTDNTGSAKTIINNHGVLENEIEHDGNFYKRFWIEVK